MHAVKRTLVVIVYLLLVIFGMLIGARTNGGRRVGAQITQTGPTSIQTSAGAPTLPCVADTEGVLDWNTTANIIYICKSTVWTSPGIAAQWFLNGVQQASVKCDVVTGTTAANGTATINISGMGFTSLLGAPQPAVVNSALAPIVVTAASATSISVLAQSSSVISLLGNNITLFANAALPYTVQVCGV